MGLRRVLNALSILAVLGAGGLWFISRLPVSYGCDMETEFESVPPDDKALNTWLMEQPGMISPAIMREQVGERWKIRIGSIMSGNCFGQPAVPPFDDKVAELGYRNPSGPFR